MIKTDLIIYKNDMGDIKIDIALKDENIWLSQIQLCEVFQRSKATISEHISSIFEEGELIQKATVRDFRTVQMEGNRKVEREIVSLSPDP